MKRQSIVGGGWFNMDKAREFVQDVGLRGKREPERLYQTDKGGWVLYARSAPGFVEESFTQIPDNQAANWLLVMLKDLPWESPRDDVLAALLSRTEV